MTAPVWQPAKTGRPRLTDPVQLLAAAREHGLLDLTVGAVTAACGVAYSTFYRSFASLDALIVDYVDQVLEERLPVSWPDGWRPHLQRLADVLDGALDAEPGLRLALSRFPTPARLGDARVAAAAALERAGFTPDDADDGSRQVVEVAVWCPDAVGLLLDGLAARVAAVRS